MVKKKIGVFQLGDIQVETFFNSDFGASFTSYPEKGKLPRIVLGFGPDTWRTILSYVHHETFEMTAALMGARYDPQDYARDASNYMFVFTHQTMSDICARCAIYFVEALPAVEKAWRKFKREENRKKCRKAKRTKKSAKRVSST
jgi:hypothetical protein